MKFSNPWSQEICEVHENWGTCGYDSLRFYENILTLLKLKTWGQLKTL